MCAIQNLPPVGETWKTGSKGKLRLQFSQTSEWHKAKMRRNRTGVVTGGSTQSRTLRASRWVEYAERPLSRWVLGRCVTCGSVAEQPSLARPAKDWSLPRVTRWSLTEQMLMNYSAYHIYDYPPQSVHCAQPFRSRISSLGVTPNEGGTNEHRGMRIREPVAVQLTG